VKPNKTVRRASGKVLHDAALYVEQQ
jgi:hypothetical protein